MNRVFIFIAVLAALALLVPLDGATAASETLLHSFAGGVGGDEPAAGLVMDQNGILYGTTFYGGNTSHTGCRQDGGCGTVYKLVPPYSETWLYTFKGGRTDGSNPESAMIVDSKGALYGTTLNDGGAGSCGIVFKLTPPATGKTAWTESILWQFTGGRVDGCNPLSGLVTDASGNLYGTTMRGGPITAPSRCPQGCGTVYELTPSAKCTGGWCENVIYRFTGGPDGSTPYFGPLLMDTSGALYGETRNAGLEDGDIGCCGTIFKLTPSNGNAGWKQQTIFTFKRGTDGEFPSGGLSADAEGSLYGTTLGGGGNGDGTVFKLNQSAACPSGWCETVLHHFTGPEGLNPQDGVLVDNGVLYGATGTAGPYRAGNFFQMTPSETSPTGWTLSVIHTFKTSKYPGGNLITNGSGVIYGVTADGGLHCNTSSQDGCGTVYELVP